jgi:hypothetical protein
MKSSWEKRSPPCRDAATVPGSGPPRRVAHDRIVAILERIHAISTTLDRSPGSIGSAVLFNDAGLFRLIESITRCSPSVCFRGLCIVWFPARARQLAMI